MGSSPANPTKKTQDARRHPVFFWFQGWQGLERRLLAACRWHAATAVGVAACRWHAATAVGEPRPWAAESPQASCVFLVSGAAGARKAAPGSVPVARCNRRGRAPLVGGRMPAGILCFFGFRGGRGSKGGSYKSISDQTNKPYPVAVWQQDRVCAFAGASRRRYRIQPSGSSRKRRGEIPIRSVNAPEKLDSDR